MKPLLLLTDFSETGNRAVEHGYQLAKNLKTNVTLCNAIDMVETASILWPAETYDMLIADSGKELKKLIKYLEETDSDEGFHPQISYQSKLGRLVDVVESLRKKEDFYMIIIGVHRKSFARFLLENHCKSMMDNLTCPLLIVPPDAALEN